MRHCAVGPIQRTHCSFACWPACSFFLQSTAHYLISLAQLAAPWKSRCQERLGQGQGVANREQHRIAQGSLDWRLAASFAQARVPAPRCRAAKRERWDRERQKRDQSIPLDVRISESQRLDGRSSTYIGAGSRDALASQSGHALLHGCLRPTTERRRQLAQTRNQQLETDWLCKVRYSQYQMPNSESAIFVGIAAAAIGEDLGTEGRPAAIRTL